MDKNIVLERFLTQIPIRFESAKTGQKLFNGIKIEVDLATKQAVAITRLQYTY
jgi:calcineurin-like phosphoesterase